MNGSRDGFNIPILPGSLPQIVFGGRLEPFASEPNLSADRIGDGADLSGVYNTQAGAAIAWKLGPHLGFSYLVGLYFPSDTAIAFASASTRQDFSLGYHDDDDSLMGHLTYVTIFSPVAHFSDGITQRDADCVSLELSALRKPSDFEIDPVAFGSIDVPASRSFVAAGCARSGQLAFGGLFGYDLGIASLQAYFTRDVAPRSIAGPDTRGWLRLVFAIDQGSRGALPSRVLEQ